MFKLSKSKSINFVKIYENAGDLFHIIPRIKKRRRRRKIYKFLKYFGFSFLGLLIFVVIFLGKFLLSGESVYSAAKTGKSNLEYAVSLIKKQKFKEAVIFSAKAEENFNFASSQLLNIKGNYFVSHVNVLEYQINDIEYLIKTAEILSKAINQGALLGSELQDVLSGKVGKKFSKFSIKEKRNILKLIYESGPELNGVKANLELAYLHLDKINYIGILWPLAKQISRFKFQLNQGIEFVSKIVPMTEILPALAGYSSKANFLVMLQNNDELRPTGGFLGTYGILEMENGDILKFDTHDIYHIDMPVKDLLNITPPEPIKTYLVDKWFMRDANWSPDWPTSAQKIEWFFEKENKLLPAKDKQYGYNNEFNGIIAITPKFVTDLLYITGPIIIQNEEYNKDNFHKLLQYKVERGYILLGVPSWQRKEIIGDILKELKIKLFDLPIERFPEILNIIKDDIDKKNILIFFKDKYLQELSKDLNFAGEIKAVNNDYLMVIDANMASFKTDAVVSRKINYNLEQGPNGAFVKLKVNYAHHGSFDWRTTRYRTYTRIYVPSGSEFIKAEGLSDGDVEIKNEFGKTSFGAFISIEPGDIGSLYFEYKLPQRIEKQIEQGSYDLFIQKQPGNQVDELVVDLNMNNKVKSYSPIGYYVEKIRDKRIRWETDLETDRGFRVNF